ncbi:MAG TPA: DEAD/DEAH box helicase family protein, partial [Streptosporangiaceae bacterium]|nr:DEAD/DEAH box helicase family protein [Streptosporangiaceae bacterium]
TAGLRGGGRGQVRMACGTGKTLVAARAAGQVAGDGGVIVVLVPSIALAAQMIAAWPAGCPVDRVLAVCSDHTVADSGVRASDLAVPVSTDPEVIAKWLADAAGRVLVVGTYDSALRVAAGLRRAGQVAGLTVCDEAHRLAGAAGKATAAILAPDVMPERRRLYLTATPRIGTGISAGGEVVVASMDDEGLFGPVLYDFSFGRAIAGGWLKDYRIVVAALADRQVLDLLDGSPGLVGDGGVPVRMAAAQAALAMTAARFGLRRCLAFVPRIAQARQFAATLPATAGLLPSGQRPGGPVTAGHVTGPQSAAAPQRGRDRDVGLGWHGDHAGRVAAGDDHARGGREGRPVARVPAQRAGNRAVGHPAGLVNPAEAVAHVIGGHRDHRHGSRQAAGRTRPAGPPDGQTAGRGDDRGDEPGGHGRLPAGRDRDGPAGSGRPWREGRPLACSSGVWFRGNFPCLGVRGGT